MRRPEQTPSKSFNESDGAAHHIIAPPGVRQQIDAVVSACREHASDALVAVYLHGSLTLGCFNPQTSDIDILVVLKRALAPQQRERLINDMLVCSAAPVPIEITFVTQAGLTPWRYPTPFDLHYSEKWRAHYEKNPAASPSAGTDEDLAAHIASIHHREVCLYGAPARDVLPVVPRNDLNASLVADFRWASDRLTENPRRVLDMCRAYFQIGNSCIVSKEEAAEGCLSTLPVEAGPAIRAALDVYRGIHTINETSADDLECFRAVISERIGSCWLKASNVR